MDVKLINPFISATLNVLETMAFTKAQAGKPYLKKEQVAPGDVSGVIGLTGEVSGTISVSFTEKCILAIVSNTHMTTYPVAIPFSTNNGEFTIEVSFEE